MSLRYQLLFPLAVLLLGDAVLTWWAASVAAANAEHRVRDQLGAVANTLTRPPTFPLTLPVLEQMSRLSGAEFAHHKRNGEWISTFPPSADLEPLVLAPHEAVVGVGSERFRIMKLSHPHEGGELYICYSEELRQKAVADAVRPTLLLGVVGGLVVAILTTLASSRLVSRIRQLDQRTRVIAAGDFRPMPVPQPADELQDLANSVNDMARRLAEYQEALTQTERLRVLGQFSGGLAHQLRNAAAGARLAIQLYMADDSGDDREPLEVALRQLARIEMNLRQFLDLGRPPPTDLQPCDLTTIVDQAVSLHRPQCQHAGVTLTWQPPGPVIQQADATQLGHLFVNIIGNAIEAAGAGGNVEVTVYPASAPSRGPVVDVSDTGPGPPADIADRLFEAFVTGKEQGIGLGLAVAKRAADAHNASLTWTRQGNRTIFRVQF